MRARRPSARARRPLALAALAALIGAAPTAAVASPSLVLEPCRLDGLATPAWCGVLPRPLDPARPGADRIDLHVAVVPAIARHKRPDPVVFLAGGPGQSAIDLAGPLSGWLARLLNRRDLVLIDQRGTGRSRPLHCPGDRPDGPPRPLAADLDLGRKLAELAACRDGLAARAGDLTAYTTPLAAADLEAVRQALGAPAWNLVAASYGTRLALEVMRQSPASVRRAVLDGVAPADMALPQAVAVDAQAALDAVWAACAADAACRQRHPALQARWAALLAELPRRIEVAHPRTGALESLVVTREAAVGLVRSALYSPALAAGLPAAVEAAAQGRWAPLFGLASAASGGGRGAGIASGQHFSVVCSEDVGPAAATAAAVAGSAASAPAVGATDFSGTLDRLYERVCADWPRAALPDGFREVRPAAAPVLVLSGGIDPVTPPRHAERVVRALGPQARHAVVPQAGHGTLAIPCLRDVVFRFIDAPSNAEALAVDAGCAATMPRPPAFVPPGEAQGPRP